MGSEQVDPEQLFRVFARALFTRGIDLLYSVKQLVGSGAVRAHLAEQDQLYESQRFHDVVYHHLPEVSFMTFRVTEKLRGTGEMREQEGIERYLFRDGRIVLKDVYRKPIQVSDWGED